MDSLFLVKAYWRCFGIFLCILRKSAHGKEDFPEEKNITLSQEQINAIEEISKDDPQENKFHFLYGTTGSGKTEVFLQVAENILKKGKSIITIFLDILI